MFSTEELLKRMTPELYVELAGRTDVDTSEYDKQRERISNPRVAEELCITINEIVKIGHRLDDLKKHIYYGKEIDLPESKDWDDDVKKNFFRASGALNDNEMTHIAHGIIGKTTEAVELCEALFNHIYKGDKFDKVNVIEEIGDGQWYDALLLRVLKVPMIKAWSINISKLFKRFGEKFSEEKAQNRDLKSERKILEG